MAVIIKAPQRPSVAEHNSKRSVFLAGSIEMGAAENWQARFETALEDLDVLIYNPRRDDWNPNWEQSINNYHFRTQVEWELNKLRASTTIAMYFDPATQSPITLLELGLLADYENLIVCCPEGYYRKGNVDIVCEQYAIAQANSFEELVSLVRESLT